MTESEKVREFNQKVADLIKTASPADLVGILKDEKSILAAHQNNNNNRMAGLAAEEKKEA
ncbi:hypothetical protein [Methylorubrum aminovorans]